MVAITIWNSDIVLNIATSSLVRLRHCSLNIGFIQGVAIWEKDMVAVILISPSSQPLQ